MNDLLVEFVEYKDESDTTGTLTQLRALLVRARKEGIDAAFASLSSHRLQRPSQQVIDAVLAFVNAKTWDAKKRIVEERRDLLLTDAARQVLADMFEQYKGNARAIRNLTLYRDLLRSVHKKGIDAAFAHLVSYTPSTEEAKERLAVINALMECDTTLEVLDLAAKHPQLLSEKMDALLEQGIANYRTEGTAQGQTMANFLEERHKILRLLRQMMEDTGMSASQVVEAVRGG